MKALIDTIFGPVTNWLSEISSTLSQLSVPVARPLDISLYLGPLALMGPVWTTVITTTALLAFIYSIVYALTSQIGLFAKFKEIIQWW